MTNRIKTPPTSEPVTLAEARAQIGIINNADTSRDAVIANRIVSARLWAESYTRRAFVTQTWTLYADAFQDCFDLTADLQSVVNVKYIDAAGVQQTLASSTYYVDTVKSRLHLAPNKSWPATLARANAVEVEYVCGFGAPAAVPVDIKDAIKLVVGHWELYQAQHEGARITTIPYAVEQLLRPYVDMRGAF